MTIIPELVELKTMTSRVFGKHYGDPVFLSRCDSWGFWSHLFDLRETEAHEILNRICERHDLARGEWNGHTIKSHPRQTLDGQLKHVQSRVILYMPMGRTYSRKRYQVSMRTVYYFLEYGVVRDLIPGCGEKFCVSPEHQILRPYATDYGGKIAG